MNTLVLRRVAPAACLVVLAPLVAEFLLGNLPITLLPALVLLAPLYGGGALLIREVTRRAGRGVPTMLVLGVAYGLLEEGVATQSLFNPHYLGLDLLSPGYVPALGIGVPWTIGVLSLHAVWSTTVPIVLVELWSGDRAPWLGRPGLAGAAALLVLGVLGNGAVQLASDPFRATPVQLAGTLLVAAVLVVVALRLPRIAGGRAGRVPHPAGVLVLALIAGAVDKLAPLDGWGAAAVVGTAVVLGGLAARWCPRAAWTARHTFAGAAGAVLTYAWSAFPQTPAVPVPPAVDLAGNVLWAVAAVALLVAVGAQVKSRSPVRVRFSSKKSG